MSSAVRDGYKQTEVGVIPFDWEVRPLKRISPKQSVGLVINPSTYFDARGTVPMLVGSNIKENIIQWEDAKRITEASNNFISASRLAAGDLVTVRVGDPGVTAVVPQELDGCNCASVMVVRKHDAFDSHWLCSVMNSPWGRSQVSNVQYGTAQKQFNISDAVNFSYAVPPLPEQRAIATALSDVDALLTKLNALVAKKRDLKTATMQQLLTGQTRLPGFSGKWEVRRLGDCLMSRPDYGINAAAVAYSDLLPVYLRITDITEDGRISPEPRMSVSHSDASRFFLNEGDLVFARTGASVGKSYLHRQTNGSLVFAGFLIRVQPDPKRLVSTFLFSVTQTSAYWDWVRQMSMRSGQPGINGNEYAQFPLSLPSLAEQSAIATILSDMEAELTALEARRDKTRALKQGMMQELLTGRIRLV